MTKMTRAELDELYRQTIVEDDASRRISAMSEEERLSLQGLEPKPGKRVAMPLSEKKLRE